MFTTPTTRASNLWNSRRRKNRVVRSSRGNILAHTSNPFSKSCAVVSKFMFLAMTKFLLSLVLCLACIPLTAEVPVARPKIAGIAHVRLYSADLEKSRHYYEEFLGFGPGTAGCLGVTRPCYTVNAHQQIEIVQITGGTPENLLAEVAFTTNDVAQMR